jgi:hypothetical protein
VITNKSINGSLVGNKLVDWLIIGFRSPDCTDYLWFYGGGNYEGCFPVGEETASVYIYSGSGEVTLNLFADQHCTAGASLSYVFDEDSLQCSNGTVSSFSTSLNFLAANAPHSLLA